MYTVYTHIYTAVFTDHTAYIDVYTVYTALLSTLSTLLLSTVCTLNTFTRLINHINISQYLDVRQLYVGHHSP